MEFVGDYGKGLNWFQEEGYDQLMKILDGNCSPMPIALVFNLGVNDYGYNSEKYVSYFRSIAQELENQNCYLFYMSVNPVDEKKLQANERRTMRKNEDIQRFNQILKEGLAGKYVWLDMYSALEKRGYATKEGLHYSSASNGFVLSRGIQMVLDANAYPQSYCWRKKAGSWYAIRWGKNSTAKNKWIRDGKGEFCLDEKGRLLREQELTDAEGNPCEVGRTGRRLIR